MWALAVSVAIVALGAIFFVTNSRGGGGGAYTYHVGKPGPGEQAPSFTLPSTSGGTFDLTSARGQTVLLYFQEGVMCEPCWAQLKDIESHWSELQALGIDKIVTITTDSTSVLRQKVADEQITTTLLSDTNVSVSKAYQANLYGDDG